jgi:beta-lactamase regulating signal transducer with metallopeptidase domain
MLLRVGLGNAVAAGLLAVLAASAGVLARGRPAVRHGLWLLVLLKLVTPPLWTVPVAWIGAPAAPAPAPAPQPQEALPRLSDLELDAIEEGLEPGFDVVTQIDASAVAEPAPVAEPPGLVLPLWRPWLLAVWGAGSLLAFAVAARRIERFRRLVCLAAPAPAPLVKQVEVLARRLGLGLGQCPRIGLVPAALSPMLWAVGCRPHLIVPRALWERLGAGQRDTLLAHELAHLKRRDHWVRWLELLVTGLYWWLPVVWIARQALREAEEQCCDAWVVWAFPGASRTYAETLLETLDFLSGADAAAAVAASGLGPVHHLKRRMTMIMQGTTPRGLTWSGLLAVLGLSAALLPLSPTWAQRPDAPAGSTAVAEAEDDDEVKTKPAAAPEKPGARDPSPRREGEGEREEPKAEAPEVKPEPRPSRIEREEGKEASEALESMVARIKELADVMAREPFSSQTRAELDRAVRQLEGLARRSQGRVKEARGDVKREGKEAKPAPRKPEAAKEGPEAEKRRAEIAQLKAEVAAHQKALSEAMMRLSRAMRQDVEERVGRAPMARGERFEFRFGRPGGPPGPVFGKPGEGGGLAGPEPMMRPILPRPDQERRIAELEERLEKLQNEVKGLKKEPAPQP